MNLAYFEYFLDLSLMNPTLTEGVEANKKLLTKMFLTEGVSVIRTLLTMSALAYKRLLTYCHSPSQAKSQLKPN